MNNFIKLMQSTSKWRIILAVFLAIFLSKSTMFIFSGFFHYLLLSSTTLSGLQSAFADIIGYGRYNDLYDLFQRSSTIFDMLLFLLYGYLFYRHEKKRQYLENIRNVIQETSYIAKGNFEHDIPTYGNNLDQIGKNMNAIVLRLKAAMEEERHIEHTKNELITNVSHDLRTPLTSIVGYLRIIEQDQYKDEVALRHYTGIAFEKALRLELLINELFEYTRMQDRRFVLQRNQIHIAEMLGELIIQNRLYFKENEMICREYISEVQAVVLGDGERLVRVFENLMINAVHYGKAGKYVDILAEEKADQVVIQVINYGNPISSIDLPHIFDRFYRADKSRTTNTGGSGLGLAIAKSIITHHGGTITVESNQEKTSFIVQLPKIDPAENLY